MNGYRCNTGAGWGDSYNAVNTNTQNSSWQRVADLKPALRSHVRIHRQHYRGQRFYVLQDDITGAFHRFSPQAYLLIGLMNGQHSMQMILDEARLRQAENPSSEDELIQLLAQLHQLDVLRSEMPTNIKELIERGQRHKSQQFKARWRSPLALRFPLLDPDRFLEATLPLVRPLFSRGFFVIWLMLLLFTSVMALMHWSALTLNLSDRILSMENLLLLWFVYPVVKGLHELGHAWALKRWGGQVHEMGIMLLVLMPVPYVDASASSAFSAKSHRMIVSGAGMMVELFLAGLAMLIWINAEPGMVRALAFNVMVVAGISTLMLNGNPLLRFDGYYLLSDWLEIPNLASRSNRYWAYLGQRYLLGIKNAVSLPMQMGERRWLFSYAPLAFVYRIFISFSIALFVAQQFFIFGIVLALWSLNGSLLMPVLRLLQRLAMHPTRRQRGLLLAAATGGLFALLLLVLPLPSATLAEGVVWVPEDARVSCGVDGFVDEIKVATGEQVGKGQLLLTLHSEKLQTDRRVLESRLKEFKARFHAGLREDRAQALVLKEEISLLEAELQRAAERLSALQIRSPAKGVVLIPEAADLPGRYLRRGEEIGYVLAEQDATVRVVIRQDDIEQVRHHTRTLAARLVDAPLQTRAAVVLREVPAASNALPNRALSLEGGGEFALDPAAQGAEAGSENSLKVLVPLFQFDVKLPGVRSQYAGGRVYVRFEHPPEAAGQRLWRELRRLFLRQFDV